MCEGDVGMKYPLVTFIVPAYNEVDNVIPFYQEFSTVFSEASIPFELIYIDDGSSDGTRQKLKGLASQNPYVLAISFSRNFGKEAAIWAGLQNAHGEVIGIIDADLQQSPKDALNMVKLLLSDDDFDIVAAFQAERHESALISFAKKRFYGIMGSLMKTPVVADASDFRVFRRKVAEAILSLPEYDRFSKGIFSWVGFHTENYPYVPSDRRSGTSKWSVSSLFKYAFSGLISFSSSPLRLASYIGFVVSAIALIYFAIVVIQKLFFGISISGYATIVCLILLLGGVQLLFLGVAGEYIGRTYIQSKQRPIYIESHRYVSDDIAKRQER